MTSAVDLCEREKCDAASEIAAGTFCDFCRLKTADCGKNCIIRYTNVTSIAQPHKKVEIQSVWLKRDKRRNGQGRK